MPEAGFDERAFGRELRASFADFAAKRGANDPGFLERLGREGSRAGALSFPFALLPQGGAKLRGLRYLFLSTRFAALISEFSAQEAAIIGGPRDRAPAAALGLPFVFTGDLAAAAGALLFGHRWIPAGRVLRRWRRFFARQHEQCVLVVPSDTLPIALLLVRLARSCPNVTVACIQHGLFNAGFDADDIEGRNAHVNLVYSPAQRAEMERRLPRAVAEVMGLPEAIEAAGGDVPTRRALLVGPGTLEDRTAYRNTLAAYHRAAAVLRGAGFELSYRPHPTEAGVHEGKDEYAQDTQARSALLAGPRRAFVGFNSTLLFEAREAGHAVVVLDDPQVPGYRLEEIGVRVGTGALQRLPEAIDSQSPAPRADQASARSRFEQALARAQERLRRGG